MNDTVKQFLYGQRGDYDNTITTMGEIKNIGPSNIDEIIEMTEHCYCPEI